MNPYKCLEPAVDPDRSPAAQTVNGVAHEIEGPFDHGPDRMRVRRGFRRPGPASLEEPQVDDADA
jgi:hypothetical protein